MWKCGNFKGTKGGFAQRLHKGCTKIAQRIPKSYPKIAQSTLELIMQNPNITIKQLSEDLALSEKTIKNRLTLLKKEGFIVRVGSKTSGYWEVVGRMEE